MNMYWAIGFLGSLIGCIIGIIWKTLSDVKYDHLIQKSYDKLYNSYMGMVQNQKKEKRTYIVYDKQLAIPYRNQGYMTIEECEKWIDRDIKECKRLGIHAEREDYEIKDHEKFI